MPKFVKLHDALDCPHLINLNHVKYITPLISDDGTNTRLYFKDSYIEVQETFNAIEKLISSMTVK